MFAATVAPAWDYWEFSWLQSDSSSTTENSSLALKTSAVLILKNYSNPVDSAYGNTTASMDVVASFLGTLNGGALDTDSNHSILDDHCETLFMYDEYW